MSAHDDRPESEISDEAWERAVSASVAHDTLDLIARLRAPATGGNTRPLRTEAADALDALAAELARVSSEHETMRNALAAIRANAEAWHGPPGDEGHARALAVIAKWASDPATIPAGVLAAGSRVEDA